MRPIAYSVLDLRPFRTPTHPHANGSDSWGTPGSQKAKTLNAPSPAGLARLDLDHLEPLQLTSPIQGSRPKSRRYGEVFPVPGPRSVLYVPVISHTPGSRTGIDADSSPFPESSGSGISPFLPISTPSGSYLWLAAHATLFFVRLPIFLGYVSLYLLVLHNLPFPLGVRKLLLWGTMAIPGIWWVDLQLDGVKRGHVAQQSGRLPRGPSVIAANFTSPIDSLYLAAVFDPIFTISYPHTRKVRHVSLLRMVLYALSPAQLRDDELQNPAGLVDLAALMRRYPDRTIVVFPECGTTNGRGILPLAPSLAAVPADRGIYPVSIRYTAPDITTPVPGAWLSFLWKLLSRPTHCIRVRIAEVQYNDAAAAMNGHGNGNGGNAGESSSAHSALLDGPADGGDVTAEEQRTLDKIAEALARLGRNKRVGLTLQDKAAFVALWQKSRRWL